MTKEGERDLGKVGTGIDMGMTSGSRVESPKEPAPKK
jgi:hypothetical protein